MFIEEEKLNCPHSEFAQMCQVWAVESVILRELPIMVGTLKPHKVLCNFFPFGLV